MYVPLRNAMFTPYQLAIKLIGRIDRWLTPLFDLALKVYAAPVVLRSG